MRRRRIWPQWVWDQAGQAVQLHTVQVIVCPHKHRGEEASKTFFVPLCSVCGELDYCREDPRYFDGQLSTGHQNDLMAWLHGAWMTIQFGKAKP